MSGLLYSSCCSLLYLTSLEEPSGMHWPDVSDLCHRFLIYVDFVTQYVTFPIYADLCMVSDLCLTSCKTVDKRRYLWPTPGNWHWFFHPDLNYFVASWVFILTWWLGSILASSMYDYVSKRIQTPHTFFSDFWGDGTCTTCSSGGRVQIWVQVLTPAQPAAHVPITPSHSSRRRSKFLTAKSMAKLLGLHSSIESA